MKPHAENAEENPAPLSRQRSLVVPLVGGPLVRLVSGIGQGLNPKGTPTGLRTWNTLGNRMSQPQAVAPVGT